MTEKVINKITTSDDTCGDKDFSNGDFTVLDACIDEDENENNSSNLIVMDSVDSDEDDDCLLIDCDLNEIDDTEAEIDVSNQALKEMSGPTGSENLVSEYEDVALSTNIMPDTSKLRAITISNQSLNEIPGPPASENFVLENSSVAIDSTRMPDTNKSSAVTISNQSLHEMLEQSDSENIVSESSHVAFEANIMPDTSKSSPKTISNEPLNEISGPLDTENVVSENSVVAFVTNMMPDTSKSSSITSSNEPFLNEIPGPSDCEKLVSVNEDVVLDADIMPESTNSSPLATSNQPRSEMLKHSGSEYVVSENSGAALNTSIMPETNKSSPIDISNQPLNEILESPGSENLISEHEDLSLSTNIMPDIDNACTSMDFADHAISDDSCSLKNQTTSNNPITVIENHAICEVQKDSPAVGDKDDQLIIKAPLGIPKNLSSRSKMLSKSLRGSDATDKQAASSKPANVNVDVAIDLFYAQIALEEKRSELIEEFSNREGHKENDLSEARDSEVQEKKSQASFLSEKVDTAQVEKPPVRVEDKLVEAYRKAIIAKLSTKNKEISETVVNKMLEEILRRVSLGKVSGQQRSHDGTKNENDLLTEDSSRVKESSMGQSKDKVVTEISDTSKVENEREVSDAGAVNSEVATNAEITKRKSPEANKNRTVERKSRVTDKERSNLSRKQCAEETGLKEFDRTGKKWSEDTKKKHSKITEEINVTVVSEKKSKGKKKKVPTATLR